MQLCPAGHYCEENTYAPYTNPCPAGNYRSDSGGKALGDCDPCGGGYYCPLEGMQSYFDPCPYIYLYIRNLELGINARQESQYPLRPINVL